MGKKNIKIWIATTVLGECQRKGKAAQTQMLENQLKECESRDILPCINTKQKDFIDKYYKQDLQFLRNFRRQLLEH